MRAAVHEPADVFALQLFEVRHRVEHAREFAEGAEHGVRERERRDSREGGEERREARMKRDIEGGLGPVRRVRPRVPRRRRRRSGSRLCMFVQVYDVHPLYVRELSGKHDGENRKNACCGVEIVSNQGDFVHVATKVWSCVQDNGEPMDGWAVRQLDLEKEHPLGSDAPGPADERTAVEGANVLKCIASEVRVQHVDDVFAELGGDMDVSNGLGGARISGTSTIWC